MLLLTGTLLNVADLCWMTHDLVLPDNAKPSKEGLPVMLALMSVIKSNQEVSK